jgi:putative hydrolase of the HAD superfamily
MHALTLLIDADDTLWENNIHFEQAIASFLSLLDHTPHTPAQMRERLNAIEHETTRLHGYGTPSFHKSLLRCYEELSTKPLDDADRHRIRGFARSIAEQEIQLLPGVAEWLPLLAARHRLMLVTKGDHDEQQDKLRRSGLSGHFTAVEVLREKNTAAYHELAHRLVLTRTTTWMIGNSPRSDVNPALDAGFHAAYVRYHNTWVLEEEELREPPPGQQLLVCDNFAEAAAHLLG